MDSIKITSLTDIGANIMYTTLVPVVNMSGTPLTQKANLQIIGNLILNGAGGSNFPRAAQSNLALSVANAAQPNITSVGTLTTLTVSGNITAGNINGGNLVVANFFSGDGGFLSNISGAIYSNSNVANYLPTYAGNVGANWIIADYVSGNGSPLTNIPGANVVGEVPYAAVANSVAAGNVSGLGNVALINKDGNASNVLYGNGVFASAPSGGSGLPLANGNSNLNIPTANGNVVITSNGTFGWTFGSDGSLVAPGNADFNGNVITLGPGASELAVELANPTLVVSDTGDAFIQGIINNVSDIGSADWVAQGHHGNDAGGYVDLGFNSCGFADANYSATGPGDGYLIVDGFAPGQAPLPTGGNLVIGTSSQGLTRDIIFTTGGFTTANIFGRISDANNALELSRAGSIIKFADGSLISDNLEATGDFGVSTPANVGFMIETDGANAYTWTFGKDGLLTLPSGNVTIGSVLGGDAILSNNTPFGVVSQGNGGAVLQWIDDINNASVVSSIFVNGPLGNPGDIQVLAGNVSTPNVWNFGSNGSVVFPTLTVDIHNGGNQQAQTLQFGDPTQQVIITGPTPAANVNAQRLIIQGQRGNGTGEGGDVYFWAGDADTNGGDIKIYAGDADNVSAGYGGYINLDGGSGFDGGGQISVTGGYSANGPGGTVYVTAGNGADAGDLNLAGGQSGTAGNDGGNANLSGGYGQNNGGAVTITGGQSALGLANYGNVYINSGASTWTFNNAGNLVLAGGNSVIQSVANSSLDPLIPNVSTMTLTPDQGYSYQALVLDPTAPGHIHLRGPSGTGNIDEPAANLFLGGESSSFEVGASYGGAPNVFVHSGGNTWTFSTDGNLITPGLTGTYIKSAPGGFMGLAAIDDGGDQPAQLVSINSNSGAGTTAISAYANNALIQANINGTIKTWNFDNTGNLTLPGNTLAINFANNSSIFGNVVQWTTAPSANTDPGTAGQAAYDSGGNLFVCVATNTWAKFAGTTSW